MILGWTSGFTPLITLISVLFFHAVAWSQTSVPPSAVPEQVPERIVTLAPSLAELAAEFLGSNLDRIRAVSDHTDFPPALQSRPKIGPYHRFNIERVVAQKPDLILATKDGNSKDQVQKLKSLGLRVVVVSTMSFSELEKAAEEIAQAVLPKQTALIEAERWKKKFRLGLNQLKKKPKKRKRVLLQIGSDPLVVVGPHTLLHEGLIWVGAENVFFDAQQAYARPNLEEVIQRKPELILAIQLGSRPDEGQEMLTLWKPIQNLLKNCQLRSIQLDELLRPSMRILHGLHKLQLEIEK